MCKCPKAKSLTVPFPDTILVVLESPQDLVKVLAAGPEFMNQDIWDTALQFTFLTSS